MSSFRGPLHSTPINVNASFSDLQSIKLKVVPDFPGEIGLPVEISLRAFLQTGIPAAEFETLQPAFLSRVDYILPGQQPIQLEEVSSNDPLLGQVEHSETLKLHVGDTFTVDLDLSAKLTAASVATTSAFGADLELIASINLSDIAPTKPSFSSTGGVNYGYTISNADLPQATTVDLYWASGTTTDTEIGGPIATTKPTYTAQGTYPLNAPASALGKPPAGAKDLLVVADPDNVISPAAPNKVEALVLAKIEATGLAWNTKSGGEDFSYAITGGDLPDAATVALYWAPSGTFDESADFPIASDVESSQGNYVFHVDPSQIPNPPDNTEDLLGVINPDDPATRQVVDLSYEPEITYISSKYDGHLSDGSIGRFFSDPPTGAPPITDETLTLQLSDSLAALRPNLMVGSFSASPLTGSGTWDGVTYVTDGFDPGTLFDGAILPMDAKRNDQVLQEDNSPAFRVQPLPGWYDQLDEPSISFDPSGGGAYTIKGALGQLGSANLLTVQLDTPVVGGEKIGATLGYGLIVTATLSQAPVTVNSYLGLDVNVLGFASVKKDIATDISLGEGGEGSSFSFTPQGTLDPATLEMTSGFGVTLKLSDTETIANVTFLDQDLYPSFFVVETGIKGTIKETLTGQVQVTYVDGKFQLAAGGGTYIQDTLSSTLTGFANAGWFIPAKYSAAFTRFLQTRLPGYFPKGFLVPQLALNNELTGSLDLTGKVLYSGNPNAPLPNFDAKAGGTINVQVKQTLVFTLGNVNLLGFLPPITYQLFPKFLPYPFKLLG